MIRLYQDAGIEVSCSKIGEYYPPQWAVGWKGPDPYLEWFSNHGRQIELHESDIGDVYLFQIVSRRFVTHGGSALGMGEFIHCPEPKVIKSRLDEIWHGKRWDERLKTIFRLHAVEHLT